MSPAFDPYRVWLSIPSEEQPANYYRLLGVELFESDDEVINCAAERQLNYVRTFQSGQYSEQAQKILKELALAQFTLLNKTKKVKYDAQLRSKINASSDSKIDDTIVVELPPPPPPSSTPQDEPTIHQKKNNITAKTDKKNAIASLTPYVLILLSAMLLEFFILLGFFLYYRSKLTADGMILAKAKSLYLQSVNLEKENNYSEALTKMTAACELNPENEEYAARESQLKNLVNKDKAEYLYKQSVELESNKRYGEALIKINAVCELVPENEEYESARSRINAIYEERLLSVGDRKSFIVNGVEFVFRWCPPGVFTMGSPKSETTMFNNEKQHQVTLTKGFWMLETEVTVGMFKAFVNDTGYESKGNVPTGWNGKGVKDSIFSWRNSGFSQDDNYPVTCVSWDDAAAFSKWLGSKVDGNIQLPTEAQWEYACRAGTTDAYAGNIDKLAWHGTISGIKPHPVKTKDANVWYLYDMHGNVREWCQDWYGEYPNESVTDPVGPSEGRLGRVYRNGSFGDDYRYSRSAFRNHYEPEERNCFTGFRCALLSDSESKSSKTETPAPTDEKKELVNQNNNEGNKKAGTREVITVKDVEFAFRWCPPGTFTMGSPESEEFRFKNETQHQVTLTKGFWMMETEVTQKQWNAIMDENHCDCKGDDLPVENVSWDDCQEFCKKCSELGMPVQLPTEAQWEYACRAGSTTAYFWGNALNGVQANCNGSDPYGTKITGPNLQKPTPVGSYQPNAWGLYDMHGNLEEWCQDWFIYDKDYPSESVTDPTGPESGFLRVHRGGGWNKFAQYCRSAFRIGGTPKSRVYILGFRCIIPEEKFSEAR